MGLFDKLTKKNNCSICGEKIGLLDATLADGFLCKNCKKKLSPYFNLSKKVTVADIEMQLKDREETNKERLASMKPNRVYGDNGVIFIDEEASKIAILPTTSEGTFKSAKTVSTIEEVKDMNPDVIGYDQIKNVDLDLTITSREDKRTVDGKQVSYEPKHFTYMCDFTMRFTLDHPYLETAYVPLSRGTVQIPTTEPRKITTLDKKFASWLLDIPGLDIENTAAFNNNDSLTKLIFGNANGLPDYSYGFKVDIRNKNAILQYQYYRAMAGEIKNAIGK